MRMNNEHKRVVTMSLIYELKIQCAGTRGLVILSMRSVHVINTTVIQYQNISLLLIK